MSATKAALVIVDMLNDLFSYKPEMAALKDPLVAKINELAAAFRKHGQPVVWIRQEFEPDLSNAPRFQREVKRYVTIRGTPGCQLVDGLLRESVDLEVVKTRYSAFFKTNLDEVLRSHDVDMVVLAGVVTHVCIRYTAVDAYQHDYRAAVASECVDSYDRVQHASTLDHLKWAIAKPMTSAEIIAALEEGLL